MARAVSASPDAVAAANDGAAGATRAPEIEAERAHAATCPAIEGIQ